MDWKKIDHIDQVNQIIAESTNRPVMIFKHSTSCSISAVSLSRLERCWDADMSSLSTYYLDLLSYRDISNEIAKTFDVMHQSPQVLVIRDGKCIHESSHFGISCSEIKQSLPELGA